MNIKKFFSVLKDIFRKPKYLGLAILIALVFYSFNVLILNYENFILIYHLLGFFGFVKSLPAFFLGFRNLVFTSSFVAIILISVLVGVLFSLIYYRTKMIKEYSGKRGFLSSSGIFFGILAPGCATCGLGLLPLLGISSAFLTFLPFDGLELSFAAIVILSFSTFKLTKDINKGIYCEVPMTKKMKGGQNE